MWASSAKNGRHWILGVWQPPNVNSLQQSRWELRGGWARHVLLSGQLQLAVLLMGIEILSLELRCSLMGQGLWQKAWLLSLCTPSWQDNSHPVWFCGLRSFLFFHLLLTQKAGLGSWKRSDKQKWFCSQGSGHFYSALTKPYTGCSCGCLGLCMPKTTKFRFGQNFPRDWECADPDLWLWNFL